MDYMTFASGIEACTVAWHPLGWKPVLFSEIAPMPCKLLKHHYPDVPNLGDMTKVFENETFINASVRLICAGTPCQSFSLAGLRGGLAAENGNLALVFARILIAKHPQWFVWENVPGVFSSKSNGESDFANILAAFRECGYSCAYRVLDAQHFGVPQRRRRVFVVGYLGNDWRPPAAVLFEPESLRGDITPSRTAGQDVAGTLDARTKGGGFPGTDGACSGHVVATLDANYGKLQGASGQDANHGHSHLVYDFNQVLGKEHRHNPKPGDPAPTLTKKGAYASTLITSVLYSIMPQNSGKDYKARAVEVTQPVMCKPAIGNQGGDIVLQRYDFKGESVRRLTPLECERLQGFPDNYTGIPGVADGPRYEAIGNSMAVPVMSWIGQRIQAVDDILNKSAL